MYISLNFVMPLESKENSKNALVASILKQGCDKLRSEQEIELQLAKNYNASLDVSLDKIGNKYNIEFSIEVINKRYLDKDVLEDVIKILEEVVYNPLVPEGAFDEKYVEIEKQVLINKIEEEKSSKKVYALRRLEEEMFKYDEYGKNVIGAKEDILSQDGKTLYKQYLKIINTAEVKVFVVGNTDGYNNIEDIIKKHLIKSRKNTEMKGSSDKAHQLVKSSINEITEYEEINQSTLCIGLRINNYEEKDYFIASIYSAILGETPSSKLFQNVREKENLAYFAKAQYLRHVGAIYAFCGVNLSNVSKAKKVINRQLVDLENKNISDEEIEAAKKYIIYAFKAIEDNKEKIYKVTFGDSMFFKNKNISIEQKIEIISKTTKEDISSFAKRVYVDTIYLLGGTEKNEN